MISYLLTLVIAPTPFPGTAQLIVDGEMTTHEIADCALDAQNGMPARLLIQDTDVTLNLAKADHTQAISVIRDNANWATTVMHIGGKWLDRGRPGKPIVSEWGEVIRVQATLTSTTGHGEKKVSLVANCSGR